MDNRPGAQKMSRTLNIVTSKPFYVTGDTVEGTAIISVPKELEHVGIFLRVGGLVKVTWSEKRGDTTYTYRARLDYGNDEWTLVKPGILPPGEHQLPFKWVLPLNMPTTFESPTFWTSNLKASVKPRIKIRIAKEGIFTSDIRHEAVIDFFELKPAVPLFQASTIPVNQCWCFSKGSLNVTISTPQDRYLPGDAIEALVSMDASECTGKASSVHLEVRRYVVATIKGGVCKKKEVVAVSEPLDALLAGEISKRVLTISLPKTLTWSTSTPVMECFYMLCVVFDYGFMAKQTAKARFEVGKSSAPNVAIDHTFDDLPPPEYDGAESD